MENRFCDLHTHSIYSDGTYTPAELIDEAERLGLSYIALTDHNNTNGLAEFFAAAKEKNTVPIAGVEISTEYKDKELHIVALYVKEESLSLLNDFLEDMRRRKEESVKALIKALCDDGYVLDYEEIKRASEGGQVNRAHISVALYEKGYTKKPRKAFYTLLSPEGKYYKRPPLIPALDAIKFIKSIGATAVIAHPFRKLKEHEFREFLELAIPAGLDAMESIYSDYDEETTALARKIAKEYGLLESGGSDFHGSRKPDTFLAVGKGNLFVPAEFAENLNPDKETV